MLPNSYNKRFQKGIVDPLSLISLGFLVVTLLVGTVAVSNPEMAFDLRESAKEIGDEVVKTTKTVTSSTKKSSGSSCGKGSDCKSGSCIRGICAGASTSSSSKKDGKDNKADTKKSTPTPAKSTSSGSSSSSSSDDDYEDVGKASQKSSKKTTTTKTVKDEASDTINASDQTPDPIPTLPPADKDRFGYKPTEEEKSSGPSYYSGDKGCKDGQGFISGTYCTPTGERRVVGVAATVEAYNKHVEAATQIYSNMSNQQLLDYAKANNLADCKTGDSACEKEAITKAEEQKLNELVVIEGSDRTTLKDIRQTKEAVLEQVAKNTTPVPTPTPDNKLLAIYEAAIDPTTSYQEIKNMFCQNEPDKAGCMREAVDEKLARENLIALLPEQYRQETKNTYKQNSVIYDYANPGVTDTDLKKKYCGGVSVCEQYFSRDMILANLTEENKQIAINSFQANFSNPNVITQFINQYDKGDTSNLTTVNKVLQLNKDAEEAFYAYKAEIAKNNPLAYTKMTDEEIAKGFYNNVYQDPVKLQAYSNTYKKDPQAFSYYTRQFGTDTKAEVNAGIVGYVNQLIETTPIPGLTDENGKLKDINSVAPEMKQKAYDLAKEEYMSACIKNGGRNSCEMAFNYNNTGAKAVEAKLAQNAQYYLNQVLLQEKGSAKLSASFSNLATVNNVSISQKLREEALRKAKQMLMDPSRTDLSFYSGPIRDSVVSDDEALSDKSLLDQIRKTTTVTSAGGNRVVTTMNIMTIDENDPKTQALIEQLANEYLERQLVEESYTRGAGLSGALVAGGLGASAAAAGCVASGIGAVASPICGVVGGIVGGISGAVSNFIPVWGNATSEEIAQEKEWITSKVGNSDIAGSIAQGFYSSQGAASINPTTGAMQVGRSSSARNNQFALLDTLINPTANLSFDSQIQMAPQVLDKWEERMEIEQKQAMDNVVIAGASGGLFAGAGGQVARTVMAGTRSIAISQGSEALAQTVVGFGLNLAQNGVQFSQNQGNFDLLSTPAQIELKDCRNKGLDCSDLEEQAMQERNQAFTQTMAVSTIMDTMMNTQQGIIAYKNQSAAINSVQTKLTQGLPLTTAEFKILADLGYKNTTDIKIEPAPIDTNPVKIAQPQAEESKLIVDVPPVEVKPEEQKPIVDIPPEVKPEEPDIAIKPDTETVAVPEDNPVVVKPEVEVPEQREPVITVAPSRPAPTVRPPSPITTTVKKVTDSVNTFVKRVFAPPVRDTAPTTKIVDTTTSKETEVSVSKEVVPENQKTDTDTGRAPPEEQKGPEVPDELLPTISIAPIERAIDAKATNPRNIKAALELETLTPKPGIDYKTGRFNPIELIKNVLGLGFRGETRKLKYDIENGKITPEQARVKATEISNKYLSSEDLTNTYIKSVDILLDQQTKLTENIPVKEEVAKDVTSKETETEIIPTVIPETEVVIDKPTQDTPTVAKTVQNALGNARKIVITGVAVTITTAGLWLGINTSNITPKIPDVANVRPPTAKVVVSPKQEYNLNLEKAVVENMVKPETKEEVANVAPEPVFELTKTSSDFVSSLSGFTEKDVINVVPSLSYADPEGNEFSVKVTGKAYRQDVETFDGAVKLLSPLSEYMNSEIELYRVSNGDLGNKIYGEASSWVDNGELQTRISYTNEYATESHLLTKRSGIPESAFTKGTVDEASFIHEFVHTMKLDLKDGKYQTSDLLTQYMNVFYKGEVKVGDQLIEYNPKDVINEQAPTKYSQSYAKGEQQRAASEDMADAIALYLTAPEWLKEHNPIRYAYVDFVVKGGDPLSFAPVEVNMLGQAVVKDTFEPIAYLPLGGSDFGKAVAGIVASIDGSKAPKGTSYDSGKVSLTESNSVIEYVAPTDLVPGSIPDGCSNCSILARAIKENVDTVQIQIDQLLLEGKVKEAIDLVESLDNRFSHDMTNQVMETGFEAQVQVLRVTADPNSAEQQLAIKKLDDAIEAGEIDLTYITDPEVYFKTRSYIDSLILQKKEIETLITNQATILERLAIYTREIVDTFQTLLGSRQDFVITEEEVDWKLKELATDPYIVAIDIPDSNSVKTAYKKPLLPDSVFKEDAMYVNQYLDIMENYLYLPLIEDTFTAQDHVTEGQVSRSDWQNEWKAQIEAKYGQEKALEMFAFLKRTQFNRNRIAQVLSSFADMDYMEIGITTPRGKAIYTELMDTYFSGSPLKNYDLATAAEKREVVEKVKELIKETFVGIEAKQ